MAYVTVPRDLDKVKNKVAFNLTMRQVVCLGIAAAIGAPFYFATRDVLGVSNATTGMVILMLPVFFFALYEKDGLPLEKVLMNMANVKFVRPAERKFKRHRIENKRKERKMSKTRGKDSKRPETICSISEEETRVQIEGSEVIMDGEAAAESDVLCDEIIEAFDTAERATSDETAEQIDGEEAAQLLNPESEEEQEDENGLDSSAEIEAKVEAVIEPETGIMAELEIETVTEKASLVHCEPPVTQKAFPTQEAYLDRLLANLGGGGLQR